MTLTTAAILALALYLTWCLHVVGVPLARALLHSVLLRRRASDAELALLQAQRWSAENQRDAANERAARLAAEVETLARDNAELAKKLAQMEAA